MTDDECVCALTFSVEHSIEEVLGLSLQLADPRPLLFESFTLRQHLAASTVLCAVLLYRQTHTETNSELRPVLSKIIDHHTTSELYNVQL